MITCKKCKTILNRYTPVREDQPAPRAGSVSVCLYCDHISIFTGEGLERREPTPAELVEILRHPDVLTAIRAVNRVRDSGVLNDTIH